MKMLQKSAVMRGTDNMVIKEIPVPQIKEKEVLVSLEYVGICGSDVHYYHNGCCAVTEIWCETMVLQKQIKMAELHSGV